MQYLLHHLLRDSAERFPLNEAIVSSSRRLNFAQAWRECCWLGGGLQAVGVARHDRVGVLLPPSVEQALAIFACTVAGAICVPIHDSLFPRQVLHVVQDADVQTLITDARAWNAIRATLLPASPIRRVILVGKLGEIAPLSNTASGDTPSIGSFGSSTVAQA